MIIIISSILLVVVAIIIIITNIIILTYLRTSQVTYVNESERTRGDIVRSLEVQNSPGFDRFSSKSAPSPP